MIRKYVLQRLSDIVHQGAHLGSKLRTHRELKNDLGMPQLITEAIAYPYYLFIVLCTFMFNTVFLVFGLRTWTYNTPWGALLKINDRYDTPVLFSSTVTRMTCIFPYRSIC